MIEVFQKDVRRLRATYLDQGPKTKFKEFCNGSGETVICDLDSHPLVDEVTVEAEESQVHLKIFMGASCCI